MPVVMWFRRDLRVHDNRALDAALSDSDHVIGCYVLDDGILSREDTGSTRLAILLESLDELRQTFRKKGSDIVLRRGKADEVLRVCRETEATALYFNEDYEPYARRRDAEILRRAKALGVACKPFFDHLLTRPGDVLSHAGAPFTLYPAFARAARRQLDDGPLRVAASAAKLSHLVPSSSLPDSEPTPTASALGLSIAADPPASGEAAARRRLDVFTAPDGGLWRYSTRRDMLDADGTSRLSHALKLGMISARSAYCAARDAPRGSGETAGVDKWLAELLWRDFYYHILWHFPHVSERAFLSRYDLLPWRDDAQALQAWIDGETGYPVVDAGMRQLRETAWLPNRARMIVAMFLCKHLLLHWQLGERHFMRHLADGDVANNNGGWQWCASTGADAAPYFRIFNPVLQGKRFDPDGGYVRRWVPELAGLPAEWIHEPWRAPEGVLRMGNVHLGRDYPKPIVEHNEARMRALAAYRSVLPR